MQVSTHADNRHTLAASCKRHARYHGERSLFQTTKLSPTLCSPPKPGCSNPAPVVAVRPHISIPAAKQRSDRVPSTQHLRRTVHMCGTVRVRVSLVGLRQVACICYICVPHRGRHRRPGRLLRSRCHQGGFLSFLLRGEPPVLPVAWSLVFGFPVDDSATAVVVRVCEDNQLRVDISSSINPRIHRYGNEESYFLVTPAAYVYIYICRQLPSRCSSFVLFPSPLFPAWPFPRQFLVSPSEQTQASAPRARDTKTQGSRDSVHTMDEYDSVTNIARVGR